MTVPQIPDRVIPVIPPLFEAARDDVERMMGETERIRDETESIRETTAAEASATLLETAGYAERAEQAAREATAWVNEGAGISVGPEEPEVRRNGHVWLRVRSVSRTPLHPGASTLPGSATFPQREGLEADGSGVVDGIGHWKADRSEWEWLRLDPGLLAGS